VGRLLLFFVLLASFDAPASAAVRYRFDNWTVDEGLPQNIVTAIHQTKDGYLWIATLDGLARFDGMRFTVFDKNNTPGINTHRFTTLFEDAAGDLWLGTESGNVTRYQRGQFRSWATNHGSPIEGSIQDGQGRLLVLVRHHAIRSRWRSLRRHRRAPLCQRLSSPVLAGTSRILEHGRHHAPLLRRQPLDVVPAPP
jgi:ligand-binding sensor domain-containing protein